MKANPKTDRRLCHECGRVLRPKRATKRFCSDTCRNRNWCIAHPRQATKRAEKVRV